MARLVRRQHVAGLPIVVSTPGHGWRPTAGQAKTVCCGTCRLTRCGGGSLTWPAVIPPPPRCSRIGICRRLRLRVHRSSWTHPGADCNYDYHPRAEQVVMSTRFTGPRGYLAPAIADGILLDGMNSDGLAVSLTFGGAKVYGPGFGIPLVIRYLLEVAGTVSELMALRRDPGFHVL